LVFVPYREWFDRFQERSGGFSSRLWVDTDTGHGRFQPMPNEALLARFYNGTFTRSSGTVTPEAEYTEAVVRVVSDMRDHVREVVPLREAFTYHDVGCGFGASVWAAQQIGLVASGNEMNREWVEAANPYCQGALSAEPLERVLDDLGHEVDLFFAAHVLEHLPDPERTLTLMARHMSRGGVAYICVPNTHSLVAMLGGRRRDPAYQFPMHLQYFSPKSMVSMLRDVGLEAIELATRIHDPLAIGEVQPFRSLIGDSPTDAIDRALWCDAVCANMLGSELFVLASHQGTNSAAKHVARTAEVAFERFNAGRRVPFPDIRLRLRSRAKELAFPAMRRFGMDPNSLAAATRFVRRDGGRRS